ncbi:MAG: 2-dehydropantoate 2-reductase [Pseudomonadota bacterium]
MKIAVMGAGAVGSYYGAMLARGGQEVTLIGRPSHVEAVQAGGLVLEATFGRFRVPMRASTDASAVRDADLVLFCVKSPDTEAAGREMAPHLAPHTQVWSLQNGVDNAERLAAVLGRPVSPAVVYVAVELAGPGHVRHHGRGELVVPPGPHSERLAPAFTEAGVPIAFSEHVRGALWAKLILNCAYNALSAITRLPYGALVQGQGVEAVMRDVVRECLEVARAEGVEVPGDVWEAVRRIAQTMPSQYSSTAQDLMGGKPTEIDHLNGHVMARGEALGVPTPVNRALWALVRLLERQVPAR